MQQRAGPVIGVIGGSGGVGASSFAAVVGVAAGALLLLDLDVDGGGVDVLLGIEEEPGARWSGIQLAGGELDPEVLVDGLPAWRGCAVLAADVSELGPPAVGQVLDSAAGAGTVVVDLPRRDCPERGAAVQRCDLVVVVARADVAGLVAAHSVAAGLDRQRSGLVVRRGEVDADDAARLVGLPLLGSLAARRGVDPARPTRSVERLAAGIVAGVRDGRGFLP